MSLGKIIYFTAFLWINASFGQQLTFYGQAVDSIVIVSEGSVYHFDKKGTTTGRADYYTITFDKKNKKYSVDSYKSIYSKWTSNPDSLQENIKYFKKFDGEIIKNDNLDSLLSALLVKYKKPSFENIGLSKSEFLSRTNKIQIRKIARLYKEGMSLRFLDKEQKTQIFRGCQSIDTFNLFLLSKMFDTAGYIIITDVSNTTNIYIKTRSNKYFYEGKYPNKYGQPWYNLSDLTQSTPLSILNFDINRFLIAIMPRNFYGLDFLKFSSLTNAYITWYLNRRNIISGYF